MTKHKGKHSGRSVAENRRLETTAANAKEKRLPKIIEPEKMGSSKTEEKPETVESLKETLESQSKIIQGLNKQAAELNDVLAMLGHDIRDPLSVIVTGNDMIKIYVGGEQIDLNGLESVLNCQKNAANRITNILKALITNSRVNQKTVELEIENMDLDDIVKEVAEEVVLVNMNEKKIQVVTTKVQINADKTLLQRVVSNLITNAAKFTKKNGEIIVTVNESEGNAIISVKDDGNGMSPEEIKDIFKRFYTKNKMMGYGLGLTIVKKIVELHDGRIEISSEVGVGSTFKIILPLQPKQRSKKPEIITV